MDMLAPLLMMLLSRSQRAVYPPPMAPFWPTPASPPPLPAFYPQGPPPVPPPSADQGGTSTPLASLHRNPPQPPPATARATPRKAPAKPARAPTITPGLLQSTQSVKRLQTILNQHGAKLKPDGLFGPKTAAAWAAAAKKKLLPSAITRVSPQTARVATTTYDVLSIPAIP